LCFGFEKEKPKKNEKKRREEGKAKKTKKVLDAGYPIILTIWLSTNFTIIVHTMNYLGTAKQKQSF
jgi:hypothetical protein